MPPIRFEHFITYTSASSIDDYLDDYHRAGFHILEGTARHDPGLRNGFLGFGPEYVEFCWVEDEARFATADAETKALREAARPFSIGMLTPDIHALHEQWVTLGYDPPPVWSKAPADAPADAEPAWSFQEIPTALEPGGTMCFILMYHRLGPPREIVIAANTTYALAGVTFVTTDPVARAQAWGRLLAPAAALLRENGACTLDLGSHLADFLTPAEYERRYGQHRTPAPHAYGELAALHLFAEEVATAGAKLAGAGREVRQVSQGQLYVAPDRRDGIAFVLSERPASDWIAWRSALTGEQLALSPSSVR